MEKQPINIYSAKSYYKLGFYTIIKGMIKNLIEGKNLIWELFLRDFKARYKQSLLGWLWIFLMPIMTMGTFLVLNISGIIRIGEIPVPYPIFGLLSFSLWQIFSNGWLVLTNSVSSAGALISQINFPKETLVISTIGQVIIDFLIRLGLVAIVYFLYGLKPSLYLLLFPIYLLPLILLTIGIGFFSSILNVIVRDTKNFIEVGLSFFLFLMPIMYVIPEKSFLTRLNRYNPIYYLIDTPRSIIVLGEIKHLEAYLFSSSMALMIFFCGWFFFYLTQTKLSERV